MKVQHLDHLNMTVRDFEETKDWYNKVFGFELVEKGFVEGEPWGVLKSGEAMLCIYQRKNRDYFDKNYRLQNGLHSINHFAFKISNRKEWLDILEGEQLELFFGGENKYPHSNSWYVKDPTGYMVEIVHWNEDKIRFN